MCSVMAACLASPPEGQIKRRGTRGRIRATAGKVHLILETVGSEVIKNGIRLTTGKRRSQREADCQVWVDRRGSIRVERSVRGEQIIISCFSSETVAKLEKIACAESALRDLRLSFR